MTSTGRDARAVAPDADAFVVRRDFGAGLLERIERALQKLRPRALQQHVAAGHRHRHRIGAGLDAVRQHAVARAAEPRHALDDQPRGADAGHPGAHLVEAVGDVADLGLLRGVLDHRRAARQHRRHQRGVGAAHRHLGKLDLAALEPVLGARNDIAGVDLDLRAERFQRHDQQIHRTRADGAAARHRNLRLAHARDQRRDHPETRAHFRNQIVRGDSVDDARGDDVDGVAVLLALARPLAGHHHVDAVVGQDALQQAHVGEPRHVVENERLIGEQARDHQRQGRVLGARDRDRAVERPSADDTNAIHATPVNLSISRLFSGLVRYDSGGIVGRGLVHSRTGLRPPPRLRFAALEVFAERRAQPFRPRRVALAIPGPGLWIAAVAAGHG